VVVLLGGDAGPRAGEIRAMLTTDADVEKGQLWIERNEWQAPEAIQEPAGDRDIATTLRYMHLSPSAKDSAIRLLETPGVGDILETAIPRSER
jgi:hypothetical protein